MSPKYTLAFCFAVATIVSGCASSSSSAPQKSADTGTTTTTSTVLGLSGPNTPVSPGGTATVSASDGVAPYHYYIISGPGSVGSSTGVYTATQTQGSVWIGVSDSAGATASFNLSVGFGFGSSVQISGVSGSTAVTTTVVNNQRVTLSGSGGQGPYTFTLVSGDGSLSGNVYTAPAVSTTGAVTLEVEDANGDSASVSYVITGIQALSLSSSTTTIVAGQTGTFTVMGGVPGYTYTIQNNGEVMNGTFINGVYTPLYAGTPTIQVTDAQGSIATASVTVTSNYATGHDIARFDLIVDYSVAFSYNNAQGNDNPSFTFWGNGPKIDAADVGKNCPFGSSFCGFTVQLNNFSNSNFAYATYRGTIGMTGRSAGATIGFCIPPTDTSRAYVKWMSGSGTIGPEISYNVPGWTLFGGLPAISAYTMVDAPSAAGTAVVTFNGAYTNDLDCSDFSGASAVVVNPH